jgi:hypothetical protein
MVRVPVRGARVNRTPESDRIRQKYDYRKTRSMSSRKVRLTVTVDPDLIEAGNRVVADGRADSLSAWVNAALVDRTIRDQRLRALAVAVEAYEQSHGEITDDEMATQARLDRQHAEVVRGQGRRAIAGTRTEGGGA